LSFLTDYLGLNFPLRSSVWRESREKAQKKAEGKVNNLCIFNPGIIMDKSFTESTIK